MKTQKLFLIASLCGVAILTAGCSTCPTGTHATPHEHQYKKQHKKPMPEKTKQTPVFYQTYNASEIENVHANMYTRSVRGGESAMGAIRFDETNDGLKMETDLIDLRPGKTYTAHVYQCFECNESTCCSENPMAIELPKIKIDNPGRLKKTYIIRGLTATQLNNAKIVLTRDGGYKAAWGILLDK